MSAAESTGGEDRDGLAGAITTVTRVSRDDDGEFVARCPHCGEVIGIQGSSLRDLWGEQFQHKKKTYTSGHLTRTRGCDGWMQIADHAQQVAAV